MLSFAIDLRLSARTRGMRDELRREGPIRRMCTQTFAAMLLAILISLRFLCREYCESVRTEEGKEGRALNMTAPRTEDTGYR